MDERKQYIFWIKARNIAKLRTDNLHPFSQCLKGLRKSARRSVIGIGKMTIVNIATSLRPLLIPSHTGADDGVEKHGHGHLNFEVRAWGGGNVRCQHKRSHIGHSPTEPASQKY